MIAETQKFFNDNAEFYLYYRSGATHLDEKYFVRTEISCSLNCSRFIYDPFFPTSHDYTLAAIKAKEKIAAYCNEDLNKLKRWGRYLSTEWLICLNCHSLLQLFLVLLTYSRRFRIGIRSNSLYFFSSNS